MHIVYWLSYNKATEGALTSDYVTRSERSSIFLRQVQKNKLFTGGHFSYKTCAHLLEVAREAWTEPSCSLAWVGESAWSTLTLDPFSLSFAFVTVLKPKASSKPCQDKGLPKPKFFPETIF